MEQLPIFLSLRDRPCLVVGAGRTAARKAALLARAGGRVTIVAPGWCQEIADGVAASLYAGVRGPFSPSHLDETWLVIAAATAEVNAEVARLCQQRRLLVNVVDQPQLCSFVMPSFVDREPLLVAVGSGGQAPVLARRVRALIDRLLPANLGSLARAMAAQRQRVAQRLTDGNRRRQFWDHVVDSALGIETTLDRVPGGEAGANALIGELLEAFCTQVQVPLPGVALVGAGPGDADLITLRGQRLLQQADVVVHDRLANPALLDLARRDAERIDVGKRAGHHAMAQQAINALLVRLGLSGQRVVRLKGGDPLTFGRVSEEMMALAEAGVPFHIVPGVTAASASGASALIPLTDRAHAPLCVLATGHVRAGSQPVNWAALAPLPASLVIYMGLANLAEIVHGLLEGGRPGDTPAAAIERGGTSDQRIEVATLETLPDQVARAGLAPPVLIMVGEVVGQRARIERLLGKARGRAPAVVEEADGHP